MKNVMTITLLGIVVAAMAITHPNISWERTELSLGQLKAGEQVELNFSFINDGTEAITILEAKGSCGCTEISFSEEEIAPGERATVLAKFRSDKLGVFNKTVKVRTSASVEPTVLRFQGTVIE